MSETDAHCALAQFLKTASAQLPALAYVWHTANESAGGAKTKNGVPLDVLKEARMGAKAGVWDWLFIGQGQCERLKWHFGIAIELKSNREFARKDLGLSLEQQAWQEHYRRANWLTAVFPESHWQNAALLLVEYCGGRLSDFRFS